MSEILYFIQISCIFVGESATFPAFWGIVSLARTIRPVSYTHLDVYKRQVHQKPALHLRLQGFWAKLATKTMPTQMIKPDRVTVEHSGAVDATGSGLAVDKRRANITLKQRAAQDLSLIHI